jgi:hypothetical protein
MNKIQKMKENEDDSTTIIYINIRWGMRNPT